MIGSACLQAIIVPRRLIAADPVVGLLGELGEWLVAASDADADIVVQDVQAAPAPYRLRPSPPQCRLARSRRPRNATHSPPSCRASPRSPRPRRGRGRRPESRAPSWQSAAPWRGRCRCLRRGSARHRRRSRSCLPDASPPPFATPRLSHGMIRFALLGRSVLTRSGLGGSDVPEALQQVDLRRKIRQIVSRDRALRSPRRRFDPRHPPPRRGMEASRRESRLDPEPRRDASNSCPHPRQHGRSRFVRRVAES